MDPNALTAIQLLAPIILPGWISVWFWRYHALQGTAAAYRWLRRYYDIYGFAARGIAWVDRHYIHHSPRRQIVNVENDLHEPVFISVPAED
jgi:hypothetical protein